MRVHHLARSSCLREVYLHFRGCNFSCLGCVGRGFPYDVHLGEPPRGKPRLLSLRELLGLLDGAGPGRAFLVGGEPTLDPHLPLLIRELGERGIQVHFLTNGCQLPDGVPEEVEGICMSLKAHSSPLHRFLTGRDNRRVLENFRKVHEEGIPLSAETVHLSGLVEKGEIGKIARFISPLDDTIPYHLDVYLAVNGRWRAPHPWEVEEAAGEAGKYLKKVTHFAGREKPIGEVVSLFP